MSRIPPDAKDVPAWVYDRDYYLIHMEDAEDYARLRQAPDNAEHLSYRLKVALKTAQIQAGMRLLDIGCGRGEIALQAALQQAEVWAVDYSTAAIEISNELKHAAGSAAGSLQLAQAHAVALPFASESFERALMLDLVEHLQPAILLSALQEVYRVLRPGGRLVIHTMTNMDYYRWGYPIYRLISRLLGRILPADPRQRWYGGDTHVNIQSPRSLRQVLSQLPSCKVTVWLQPLYGSPFRRWLIAWPIWRWLLVNDILAVAIK